MEAHAHKARNRILIHQHATSHQWWIETARGVRLEGPFPSREAACVAIVSVILERKAVA